MIKQGIIKELQFSKSRKPAKSFYGGGTIALVSIPYQTLFAGFWNRTQNSHSAATIHSNSPISVKCIGRAHNWCNILRRFSVERNLRILN